MAQETWIDLFGQEHVVCKCRLCVEHARLESVMQRGNIEEMKQTMLGLMDEVVNLGADLNYAECVLDGSWPTAVEQLERALVKAKEHRKADEKETNTALV